MLTFCFVTKSKCVFLFSQPLRMIHIHFCVCSYWIFKWVIQRAINLSIWRLSKHKLNYERNIEPHEIMSKVPDLSTNFKTWKSRLPVLGPARMKFPVYNEKDKCIAFDAGLMNKIKRQIIIRIQSNQVMYTFESELDALKKLADGHRHQVQRRITPSLSVPMDSLR